MNKKISLGVAVTIVIAFVAATFAITMSVSQRIYNKLISNLQQRIVTYSLMDEADSIVRDNYYGVVSESSRNGAMISGYINGLNDISSYYLSANAYSAYLASIKGEVNGTGISATYDSSSGYILVLSVLEGSPAASAGIKSNDLISVIDGEAVTRDNYLELINKLNGNKLTSVKITYIRDKNAKTVSVMMGYSSRSVSTKAISEDIFYIKIDGFYQNTADQLKDALDSIPQQAKSIIFDLRETESGTIQYTTDALKLVVPIASSGSGALATEIDKNGKETYYSSNAACLTGYNIAVLVDSETSCCGELFACDLRDFGMAVLIGERTAGNANVQKSFSLSDGSGIILTVAKVKPYITETFDAVGLLPDIQVENENGSQDDAQLQQAIGYLSSES